MTALSPVRGQPNSLPDIGGELRRRLASMPAAIEAGGRRCLAAGGDISSPLRSSSSRCRVLVVPAEHVPDSGVIDVLTNSALPREDRTSIDDGVTWLAGDNGSRAALVDASSLTALQIGSASGLATPVLALEAGRVPSLGGAVPAALPGPGVSAIAPSR